MRMLSRKDRKPPVLLEYRSSKWFILTTVVLAVFTDIFLYGVIVPVIPFAIESRAGVSANDVQHWVSVLIAVYGASLLAFSPICGWIADNVSGRREPLVLGLLALAGATVMLNIATRISVLIVARVLQGCSAAVVWVVGLALLSDTIDPNEVGTSMGYTAIGLSFGMILAPVLGGIVFDRGGYNAVFAMCYALIALDVILRLALIEKKDANRWKVSPPAVSDVETLPSPLEGGDTCEIKSCQEAQSTPEPVDRNGSQPPLQRVLSKRRYKLPPIVFLMTSRRLVSSLFGALVQAILMTCFDSVLPIHVKKTFGWSATGAGLVFLPIIIPSFVAPVIGWASDKYGPRWLSAAGFLLACPVFICLRFVEHDSMSQKVLLCALLALIGLAMTLSLAPIMAEITYVVTSKEQRHPGLFGTGGAYAQAYGLFNMAFAGGAMIGPIWAGFVTSKAGWGTMAWSLGLLSFFCIIPTALFVGGSLWKHEHHITGTTTAPAAGSEER